MLYEDIFAKNLKFPFRQILFSGGDTKVVSYQVLKYILISILVMLLFRHH